MDEKMHLFHSISENGEENASVRKFIVDHNLKEQIEFHNTAYEGSQKLIRELSRQTKTPCLVVGTKILIGDTEIIEFLSKENSP